MNVIDKIISYSLEKDSLHRIVAVRGSSIAIESRNYFSGQTKIAVIIFARDLQHQTAIVKYLANKYYYEVAIDRQIYRLFAYTTHMRLNSKYYSCAFDCGKYQLKVENDCVVLEAIWTVHNIQKYKCVNDMCSLILYNPKSPIFNYSTTSSSPITTKLY